VGVPDCCLWISNRSGRSYRIGPKKLPELGKGIGLGIRGFKSALQHDEKPADATVITAKEQE
jgi:mttA/Hcf106 family protein